MMTSAAVLEDRPAYDVMARKTVDILDVVSSTRLLLIEQYNNDQTMWLEAMFRILMWKNQTFLLDERNSSTRDPNVHKFLKDLILEMFRVMDEPNAPTSDSTRRSQLLEIGCNLISTFRVFTNFILQSKLDVSNDLANLQYIAKNIEKYVQKHNDKSEKAKLADQEEAKSVVSEPEKVKSLKNEPQKMKTIANETDVGRANGLQKVKPVANEPLKVKLGTTEPLKVKTTVNEFQKLKSATSESQKMKPIGSENVKAESVIPFHSQKMKPATSKRNINEVTFGFEATELAGKDFVVVSEKRSTTPADVGANDHLCKVCNDPITVFNHDKEFSLLLHQGNPKHKKAVKKSKTMLTVKDVGRAEPEENDTLTSDNDVAMRKAIIDLVGETQARFFEIDVGDEFFCTVCKCSVYSTLNVVTHVQGRNHKKNCGFLSQESKESKSGSDSKDLTSDEVDSAEDESVLRVGSAIPVRPLFDSL